MVNTYWSKFLKEITDTNSKIVALYVNLKPIDILTLDFRKLFKIDGNYYRLNKVIDFDPYGRSSTKVELLKIRENVPHVPHFTPITPPIINEDIIEGGQDEVRAIGAVSYWNVVEGGLNEVRAIGATSFINVISGGNNSI